MIPADATIFDWMEAAAAFFSSLAVGLLVFDRAHRPHGLEIAATTSWVRESNYDLAVIIIRSARGEMARVERVYATHGIAICGAPASPIAIKRGERTGGWSGGWPARGVIPQGSEEVIEFRYWIWDTRSRRHRLVDAMLGRRRTLRFTGYLPFRRRQSRFELKIRVPPAPLR